VENSELDFVVGEGSASDSAVLSIELGARAAGLLGEVGGTSGTELVAASTIALVGLADLCAVDRPVPEFAKLLLQWEAMRKASEWLALIYWPKL
jgi:hypothetical protein